MQTLSIKYFAILGTLLFLGVATAPSIYAEHTTQININEPKLNNQQQNQQRLINGLITYYEKQYHTQTTDSASCDCDTTHKDWQPFKFIRCLTLYIRVYLSFTLGMILYAISFSTGSFYFLLYQMETRLLALISNYYELDCDDIAPLPF